MHAQSRGIAGVAGAVTRHQTSRMTNNFPITVRIGTCQSQKKTFEADRGDLETHGVVAIEDLVEWLKEINRAPYVQAHDPVGAFHMMQSSQSANRRKITSLRYALQLDDLRAAEVTNKCV